MKLRTTASLAALAAGLMVAAGSAQAQSYSKIVVFGDSLSDNGNLGPANGPGPPYYNYHFSNGPVWVEQLGFGTIHNAGPSAGNVNVDWAFGGARSDNNPNPVGPTTPGIPSQVFGFGLSGGTLNSSSLVTLWGGANDIIQQVEYFSVVPPPSAAVALGTMQAVGHQAALNIAGEAAQLASAGAGTILVPNLPRLSATPAFNGPSAGPVADAGVNAFDATLPVALQAVAAAHPATNIIQMDIYSASSVFQANPALFGFTNVTQSCFTNPPPAVCATPGSYLYWDGVHPTTAGHHVIAELAMEYLYYGSYGAPTAAEGEAAARNRGKDLDAALVRLPTSFEAGQPTVSLSIEGGEADVAARNGGLMPKVQDKSGAARIVLSNPVSDTWRWGGQFSANRSDVRAGALGFHAMSYSVDGYAGWRSGSFFVNAVGGFGADDFQDIKRTTAVAPLVNTGRTTGYTGGAKLQGGINFPFGGGVISPRVAVSYVHEQVDGYTENGLLVKEHYASRTISATAAEATVRFEAPLGERVGGFAEVGYRDNAGYDAGAVVVSLPGNTALPLSTNVAKPERGMGLADVGVHAAVTDHITLGVSYRGRFGSGFHDNDGIVSLKWKF